jgi:transposase
MNAFPNPHSVLILDNCPIHHQRRVMESAHARGILVRFLEPYDPDSMPVENAYKIMKNWLRGSTGRCSTTWVCLWSRSCAMAMRSVSESESGPRHCFHQAGYV